jgi:hypothetical protein
MKKFLLVVSICFWGIGLKAQTLEQTTEFIETTIAPYSVGDTFISFHPDSIKYSNITTTHGQPNIQSIKYNNIKSITHSKEKIGDGTEYIWIDIVGRVTFFSGYDNKYTNQTHFSIRINDNTPIPIVEKLIKAIKHAAELKGAKLVNENMF